MLVIEARVRCWLTCVVIVLIQHEKNNYKIVLLCDIIVF